jgi:hypothetical protein
MVATVLRDPFASLIRKIGYSVGLENTRERLGDLVELYVADRQITTSSWLELVTEKWNIKPKNIADVFASLNVLSVHQGAVDVLFGLDGLGVTRLLLGEAAFPEAADAIFCLLLIAADADVFLNCLAVDFEPERVREILLKMIASKRELAHEAIRLSGLREKVDRVINIEAQRTNRGSSSSGKGVNLLTRTQPLTDTPGPLARQTDAEPTISDDYLRKVPPKRRDWARSIGLFGRAEKKSRGDRLLHELNAKGVRNGDGSYGFWPFEPELMALHLTPSTAPWPTVTFEELCQIVERVFAPSAEHSPVASDDIQFEMFSAAFTEYKSLNVPKAALRGELPLRVAWLFQLGWNVTQPTRLSLARLLDEDQMSLRHRVETRSSRSHEGALIVRRGQ